MTFDDACDQFINYLTGGSDSISEEAMQVLNGQLGDSAAPLHAAGARYRNSRSTVGATA